MYRYRTGLARQDENRLQKYQNYISGLEINRPPPKIKHRYMLAQIKRKPNLSFQNFFLIATNILICLKLF